MRHQNSYAALAASIERSIRSDYPTPEQGAELTASIDVTLRKEARTGELRLAWVRAGVVGINVALSPWVLSPSADGPAPAHPLAGALLRAAWAGAAAALLVALRAGWYRHWVRYAGPAVDAAMIVATFLVLWPPGAGAPMPAAAVGYAAALCGFLAASGALRLSPSSARLGAGLAIVAFVAIALQARLALPEAVATGASLLALGVIAASVTALIRRVVTQEVGRLELSRMYQEARLAIDAREEVLKMVSHDLRNPLSTISMSAQMMLEGPVADAQRTRLLTIIVRGVERMNRMIQDLLDVAKLEAGRLGMVVRPVDVAALVAEAEETLRPLAAERSIRLESAVARGLPTVTADADRVQQVIGNLVSNAIKFTPAGGRITLAAACSGDEVRFAVTDTGCGIPPDHLSRVFRRFWQADRTDRRGIGLGLAISEGIVQAHGGRIWVESRVGVGTTFFFTLGEGGSVASGERRGA